MEKEIEKLEKELISTNKEYKEKLDKLEKNNGNEEERKNLQNEVMTFSLNLQDIRQKLSDYKRIYQQLNYK